MVVRSKRGEITIRRRRHGRTGYRVDHSGAPGAPQEEAAASGPRRRHGGASQDQALYACPCGVAFGAIVSTSVDCPRCGRTQAW